MFSLYGRAQSRQRPRPHHTKKYLYFHAVTLKKQGSLKDGTRDAITKKRVQTIPDKGERP
jgi:hypothetical protein